MCTPCQGQYISKIFMIPKPNGKKRFILNLKSLNKFIDVQHFKLEDLRTAIKLISENCYISTLDCKDAYFLVKIHEDSKKYLRFKFDSNLYEFNVLPFGISTAPYVFTKIMKPVAKLLRSKGYLSTFYLDDILLIGNTYDSCLQNINELARLLTSLGFLINMEKTDFIPKTFCRFLGFNIDSINMEISLPLEKRSN